jgi:hypothetical protein
MELLTDVLPLSYVNADKQMAVSPFDMTLT